MIQVSDHYRKLEAEEIPAIAAELENSWQDPAIPMRQWVGVVRGEIQRFREGERQRHFDVLLRALRSTGLENPSLLDIGASSGFYSEILKIGGFDCRYTALDYSPAYEKLAQELFPGICFQVGDARALPYLSHSFDIALSGCCLLHIADYRKAIEEAARVARHFVVLNRTPVVISGDAELFEKSAYGVRTMEQHFNEAELLRYCDAAGLGLVSKEEIFSDPSCNYRSMTYLFES